MDMKGYHELWSKLRWALGTSYGRTYTKRSEVGEIARRMALQMVETNGMPTT